MKNASPSPSPPHETALLLGAKLRLSALKNCDHANCGIDSLLALRVTVTHYCFGLLIRNRSKKMRLLCSGFLAIYTVQFRLCNSDVRIALKKVFCLFFKRNLFLITKVYFNPVFHLDIIPLQPVKLVSDPRVMSDSMKSL